MFLHTFHPQPVLFQLGNIKVYWYGIFIAIGILAAFKISEWMLRKYKYKFSRDDSFFENIDILDLTIYLLAGGLIGARLFYVLSEWRYFILKPLDIFKVWNGGLWIYGAIFGGFSALFIWKKIKNKNFFLKFFLDLIAPGIIFAQAIGRWGNYFNQELYGLPTKLSWGIPVDIISRVSGFQTFEYFHPTFLYESLWCAVVGIFLIGLHFYRIKKMPANTEIKNIA
ncbi:MAG: prolipoprotein diacylglyceryl transferase, partial [bacterium]